MMKKPGRLLLLVIITAGALGLGFALWKHQTNLSTKNRYRTENVDRGEIVRTVSANGTLNPVVLVNVGTQVSGTVRKLHADFNDRVRAGQVLAELDPSLFKAQLEQSRGNLRNVEAALKLALANERRVRALLEKDFVSQADMDQAVEARESAEAQVTSARGLVSRDETNLSYSIIRSPVSGVVVSRNIDIGQTVAASFQTPTLFQIAQDLKRMQIDSTVAEADIGVIQIGQAAHFTVDAFPDEPFQGTVRQIRLNPTVQQNVVTYNVVVDVANPDEILKPGMTAFLKIVVGTRKDVLRIPLAALRYQPSDRSQVEHVAPPSSEASKTVYRILRNKIVPVSLRTGLDDGHYAELLSGELTAGTPVVVEELESAGKTGRSGRNFRFRF